MIRIKNRILLVSLYCLFVLLCCEAATRLLLSRDTFFRKKFLSNIDIDSYWRIHFIETRSGVANPKLDCDTVYDPLLGWVLNPGITNKIISPREVLNTNSKGIRGTVEYSYDKPKHKKRILVLGDSFTYGLGVKDNETYASLLQETLEDVEVINFAIPGYGHDQMLIYLKKEGIKYKPDIVVLGYLSCDVVRNILSFMGYAKPMFKLVNNQLVLKNSPVPPVNSILRNEFYRLKIADLLNILYQSYRWKSGKNDKEMLKVTEAILDEMAKTIKSIGAVPVFVYEGGGQKVESESCADFLLKLCSERQINCLTLIPAFNEYLKKGIRLCNGPNDHWNATGHRVIAREIREYLLREKIL